MSDPVIHIDDVDVACIYLKRINKQSMAIRCKKNGVDYRIGMPANEDMSLHLTLEQDTKRQAVQKRISELMGPGRVEIKASFS